MSCAKLAATFRKRSRPWAHESEPRHGMTSRISSDFTSKARLTVLIQLSDFTIERDPWEHLRGRSCCNSMGLRHRFSALSHRGRLVGAGTRGRLRVPGAAAYGLARPARSLHVAEKARSPSAWLRRTPTLMRKGVRRKRQTRAAKRVYHACVAVQPQSRDWRVLRQWRTVIFVSRCEPHARSWAVGQETKGLVKQ